MLDFSEMRLIDGLVSLNKDACSCAKLLMYSPLD